MMAPTAAVTETLPAETPRTTPVWDTVATAPEEVVQVNVAPATGSPAAVRATA